MLIERVNISFRDIELYTHAFRQCESEGESVSRMMFSFVVGDIYWKRRLTLRLLGRVNSFEQ